MAKPLSEVEIEDGKRHFGYHDGVDDIVTRLFATIDQLQAVGEVRTRERNEAWDTLARVRKLPEQWLAEAGDASDPGAVMLRVLASQLERALKE